MVSHTFWILVRNECLYFKHSFHLKVNGRLIMDLLLYQKSSCSHSHIPWKLLKRFALGLCKIDSWIWTIFSFFLHMMTWWLVLVMVPTVFDKTQARARKSIFCLKKYKNVVVNHLELIRDKLKILFGAENSGLKWG